MSHDFLRSIWLVAASFYIKNLCHHTSPYLVCQSLDHLSPSWRVLNFFVWVNCICGIFFLCFRSSCMLQEGTHVLRWWIFDPWVLFISPLWKLHRAEWGRGTTRDVITRRDAEFESSQLLWARLWGLLLPLGADKERFPLACRLHCEDA